MASPLESAPMLPEDVVEQSDNEQLESSGHKILDDEREVFKTKIVDQARAVETKDRSLIEKAVRSAGRYASIAMFAGGMMFSAKEAGAAEANGQLPQASSPRTISAADAFKNIGLEEVGGSQSKTIETAQPVAAVKPIEQAPAPQVVYVETKPQIETKKAERENNPLEDTKDKVKTTKGAIRDGKKIVSTIKGFGRDFEKIKEDLGFGK